MRKSSKISNNLEIDSVNKKETESISNIDDSAKTIVKLYKHIHNALKIITIALVYDETDFFADENNIKTFFKIFDIYGITLGEDKYDIERFNKDPIQEWKLLISLLLISLYSLPNHGGVYCDKIIYNEQETEYFCITIDTNLIDKKQHILGFMLSKDIKYVTIDNEVIMT